MLYTIAWILCWSVIRVLFKVRVFGKENIPQEGRFIVASHHISLLDPPLLGTILPLKYKVSFMAKKELFDIPILGFLIRCVGSFPVKRGGADLKALSEAVKVIKSGRILCIFPEGTRSRTGEFKKGHPGVALLALESSTAVLPVSLCRKRRKFRRSEIRVGIGEPFNPGELFTEDKYPDFKERIRCAADYIMERIKKVHQDFLV